MALQVLKNWFSQGTPHNGPGKFSGLENFMEKTIPKLFFESGYLLDSSYERAVENQPVIEDFRKEARENWVSVGENWLQKTITLVGKEFTRNEITANLVMHPDLFSCSHPFLININKHLPKPDPLHFSELVYHELLHFYLDSEFSNLWELNDSKLLEKYKEEDDHVTAHLHLYAIEKRVLLECDQQNLWNWVVDSSQTAHSPGYQRAIEILDIEGEQAFWDELIS